MHIHSTLILLRNLEYVRNHIKVETIVRNRPYSPSWLSMDSLIYPSTSVAMYRRDFKHTLSYCVDSFEMYMYAGFLELWKYYTYILNYTKCFT